MRIGKTGLNPTMPICWYCGEAKGEIILTGLNGELWAKKNGRSDGQMPTQVLIEGDIEPCTKCKERGIAIVEVVSDEDRSLTERRWLLKEEAIKGILNGNPMLESILKKRIMMVSRETAEKIGLYQTEEK